MGVPQEVRWGVPGEVRRAPVGVPKDRPGVSPWVSPRRCSGDWGGVSWGPCGCPQGGASGCPRAWGVSVGLPKEVHRISMDVPKERPAVSPWASPRRSFWVSPGRSLRSPRCPHGDVSGPHWCPQEGARGVPLGVPKETPLSLGMSPWVSHGAALGGSHQCHRGGSLWGGHGPQPPPGAPPQALPSEGEEDELPEEEEEEVGDGRTPAAEPAVSRRTEERSRKPPGRSAAEQGGQWRQQRGCSAGSGGRVGVVTGLWWW